MKNMRVKYGSLATLCLLLLALLPASCIQDEYAAKEKATVRVTFTTRAISGSSDTDANALETHEHMRTLRVIVARASDNDILYNVKYAIAEDETYKTITFSELTIAKGGELFDFYAIANENGVGYTGDWATITVDQLKNISLTKDALDKLNLGSTYIPQTAHAQIKVGEATEDVTIPLQFAVAKVRLTIENTSAETQTVSDISLSGVDMTSTPLFADAEGNLSVENGGSVSLGTMTINGTPGKSTVYAYFYENTGGEYKLDATWNGSQTLSFGSGTKYNIGSIPRGTELDINVTLSVNTKPTIDILVVPWEEKSMGVTFD